MSTIKSRIFIRVIFLLTFLTPTFSFAQSSISGSTMGFDNLNKLIQSIASGVVQSTGYMMLTLAVVAFFFGIVEFIWSARMGAEGKGIQRGTQFMKWGLIGLFVMFSVWGIIKFAQGVIGIQGDNTIRVPSLNFTQTGSTGIPNTTNCTGTMVAGYCIGGSNTSIPTGCPGGYTLISTGQCISNTTGTPNKISCSPDYTLSPSGQCISNSTGKTATGVSVPVPCNAPYILNVYGQCVTSSGVPAPVTTSSTGNNPERDACLAAGGGSGECNKMYPGTTGAATLTPGGSGIGTQGSSCTTSANCESGLICDTKSNPGFAYCAYDVGAKGSVTQGGSCNINSDCESGLICDTKSNPGFAYCAYATSGAGAGTQGSSCNINSDCGTGLTCDTKSNPGFAYCDYSTGGQGAGGSSGGSSSDSGVQTTPSGDLQFCTGDGYCG